MTRLHLRSLSFVSNVSVFPVRYLQTNVQFVEISSTWLTLCKVTVLRYLDSYASDQLTQAQAHLFTRAIDLLDGRPTIQEAIKLCYYMRSLGFDTYARILPTRNVVRLHVVVIPEMNEGEMVESQDKIYWVCIHSTTACHS